MRLQSALLFAFIGVALGFVATCLLEACASSVPKSTEAEAAYFAAQTKCASTEPSREAIERCRERVREEWAVKKDGGR